MTIYCVEETDGYQEYGRTYFTKDKDAEAYKELADQDKNVVSGFWYNVIHQYELNETFNTKEK